MIAEYTLETVQQSSPFESVLRGAFEGFDVDNLKKIMDGDKDDAN